jgi:hypothetical protein
MSLCMAGLLEATHGRYAAWVVCGNSATGLAALEGALYTDGYSGCNNRTVVLVKCYCVVSSRVWTTGRFDVVRVGMRSVGEGRGFDFV